MPVDNVLVFTKLNELVNANNEHSEALRELYNMFLEMHTAPGIWGIMARSVFAHYVKKRAQQPFTRLELLDIPPVIPGTLEVDRNAHGDDSRKGPDSWPNGSGESEGKARQVGRPVRSIPRARRVSPPDDREGLDQG